LIKQFAGVAQIICGSQRRQHPNQTSKINFASRGLLCLPLA
jgi:hypothetical protein